LGEATGALRALASRAGFPASFIFGSPQCNVAPQLAPDGQPEALSLLAAVFLHHSVSVTLIAFQACSIDHSDIFSL
jgi:hypothetical protein